MVLAGGARIGHYEILGSLGAGGMGEVYRARDLRLERTVAIKVITSAAGTPVEIERFQREARAIARLSHPHICTLYDVGQEGGTPFLVMEFLEGQTLARRLERGALSLDRALAVAAQTAEALDASHRAGVIHRDLKPSNIFLVERAATPAPAAGRASSDTAVVWAKLLDFGLAKLRDNDYASGIREPTKSLSLTAQGTVLGTLPYMAPEQVEGRTADARTDIFALGIVLYEMVTGRAPFQGTSPASLAAAILTSEPPPVSSLNPIAPVSLDRIVSKCLDKNAEDRWQSAQDSASALRWSADDSRPSHRTRDVAPVRRSRRLAIALSAAAAALVATAAAVVWTWPSRWSGAAASTSPRFTPVTFRPGTLTGARFAPDGDTIVYSAAWGGDPYALFMTRRDSVESRRLDVPDARLVGVSSAGELAFLRGRQDTLRILVPVAGTLLRGSLAGGSPREILDAVVAADWKPGTSDLAVVRRDQVEFPVGTRIYGDNAFSQVRIAPDGQHLALVEQSGRNIVVLDRSGRKTVLSSGWGDLTSLAWSPSGNEVWFTTTRRDDLTTWALRAVTLDGRERVVFPFGAAAFTIHDALPSGRLLIASMTARMGCSCVTPGTTQPRELGWLDGPAPEALSADGGTILLGEMLRGGGPEGAIYLRRTDGSEPVRLGSGFPEDLSPDRKWVLATAREKRAYWTLLPTGPGVAKTLPAGPFIGRGEANFLPDGRGIVFNGVEPNHARRIYVQDIETGTVRAVSPEFVGTNGLATADGRFVLGVSRGRHSLYPVDGTAPVPIPALAAGDVVLQSDPDGRHLYVSRAATWPPVVDRVDMQSGERAEWKTIQPASLVGLDRIIRILITPDGTTYCHDYVRFESQLFVVEGLT